jgi:hypothetical protein
MVNVDIKNPVRANLKKVAEQQLLFVLVSRCPQQFGLEKR